MSLSRHSHNKEQRSANDAIEPDHHSPHADYVTFTNPREVVVQARLYLQHTTYTGTVNGITAII
jgi:hypothetical protein